VTSKEFNLVQVHEAPTQSPTLLPECGIALFGAGLFALSGLSLNVLGSN
jgi:hypothetical protein